MAWKMTAEVAPSKWQPPGRHLIQHRAEAEEIRASIDRLAARLFGRHIGDRADGRSRTGEQRAVERGSGSYRGLLMLAR